MIPYAGGYDKEQEANNEIEIDHTTGGKIRWKDRILLNRPLKVLAVLLVLAVMAPLLLYHFIYYRSQEPHPSDGFSIGSCLLRREDRIPCGVGAMDPDDCPSACCYDNHAHSCYHRLPSRFSYISQDPWTEDTILTPRMKNTPFQNQPSLQNIRLSLDEISKSHLAITLYNTDEVNLNGTRLDETHYSYTVRPRELNIKVKGPNGVVFDTARGPLIAANNIWEMFITVTNETMYGLGELPLKNGMVKVLYSHDNSVIPVPLIYAKMGTSYHGILIDTVNPTEVRIIGENRLLVRSISNVGLKFHVFIGPTPKDVMKDVVKLIGTKEFDYWMLGAHFCSSISTVPAEIYSEVASFIGEASANELPYESHCGVSPLMFENECENELVAITNTAATVIRNSGKKYIPHVLPYVHYEEVMVESNEKEDFEIDLHRDQRQDFQGTEKDCSLVQDFGDKMLRDHNSDLYQGTVGVVNVIYPDYSNATEVFMRRLWAFQDADGLILKNNWPLDESLKYVNETYQYLPYFSEAFETAFQKTPQWNASYSNGEKYLYTHNQYGQSFASAINNITEPETPIWSTSQRMSGEIWVNRQNIETSWTSFKNELVEVALGGASGQWLWSSSICGDTDNFETNLHSSLCLKWYMAATYLPMIKVHSKTTRRDPMAFEGTYRKLMIDAFQKRLSFMSYFYTVLQEGPLLRPMFYQFPSLAAIANINTQFSVGDHLMVVPNFLPNAPVVHLWLPPGMWYEFWSGLRIDGEEGDVVSMTTLESDFVTLVQGGSVVATQLDVRANAALTRLHSPFTITVALQCDTTITTDPHDLISQITTIECYATGKLFVSQNLTVAFTADDNQLSITAVGEDFEGICGMTPFSTNRITTLKVYGLRSDLNNVDNYKLLSENIDLCTLQQESIINITY